MTSDHAEAWLCTPCSRLRPPPFERLLAAWSYEPPIDAVVQALKYRRLDYLAEDLAVGMAQALSDDAARRGAGRAGHAYRLIVPVPLHWRRRWERGFDQAFLLARGLASHIGVPCRRLLVRARFTASQTGKTAAERRQNMAGAFACRRRCLSCAEGTSVLLVDDVATTGATLTAAAQVLRRSGARRITALVAALTPKPGLV